MRLLAILVVVAGLGAAAGSAHTTAGSAPIAFTVRDRGITKLYVIRPDGTGLRQLTPKTLPKRFLGDVTPAWSPDGRSLAFARNSGRRGDTLGDHLHLFRVAAEGGR